MVKKVDCQNLEIILKNNLLNVGLYGAKKLFLHRTKAKIHGCSSVGRALVSKTRCREFESLLPCSILGELAEWSKAHAWKVCKPQKGFEGSNPSLSAKKAILF